MNKWKAIVFDLDDTLYPESEFVLSGFRAVAAWGYRKLGIDAEKGFSQLRVLFDQGVRGNTFDLWLEQNGFGARAKDIVPQLVEVYRQHWPQIQPFPEVHQVLAHLRETCSLGLVSDGYLVVQERKLQVLGLAHFFDAVVFSDRLGPEAWKPSARPFEEVLSLLGVGPQEAAYVGDNPSKDFLGPWRIGMDTVWVHRPGSEYAALRPPSDVHRPDHVIGSLQDLIKLARQGADT